MSRSGATWFASSSLTLVAATLSTSSRKATTARSLGSKTSSPNCCGATRQQLTDARNFDNLVCFYCSRCRRTDADTGGLTKDPRSSLLLTGLLLMEDSRGGCSASRSISRGFADGLDGGVVCCRYDGGDAGRVSGITGSEDTAVICTQVLSVRSRATVLEDVALASLLPCLASLLPCLDGRTCELHYRPASLQDAPDSLERHRWQLECKLLSCVSYGPVQCQRQLSFSCGPFSPAAVSLLKQHLCTCAPSAAPPACWRWCGLSSAADQETLGIRLFFSASQRATAPRGERSVVSEHPNLLLQAFALDPEEPDLSAQPRKHLHQSTLGTAVVLHTAARRTAALTRAGAGSSK